MCNLLTKEQAAAKLQFTPEVAEKLLAELGVPKLDFSLIKSKGIRYRESDIEEALEKIEVLPKTKNRPKQRKRIKKDIFNLTINEQMELLTHDGPKQ